MEALWQSDLPGLPPPRRGKVRDVYDLGDALLIVATDRLSAYDHVLRPGIPGKGKILNQLSNFWFGRLSAVVPNHLLATDPADFPAALAALPRPAARAVRAGAQGAGGPLRVRGPRLSSPAAATGSTVQTGTVCGIPLPAGPRAGEPAARRRSSPRRPRPRRGTTRTSTSPPSQRGLGPELAARPARPHPRPLPARAPRTPPARDLILADTKFEFGHAVETGELLLIDEVLTPDSSRYWDVAHWLPGEEPASFDKQFVRNWLDESGWDKESPPPELPADVVRGTLERYVEAFRRITGRSRSCRARHQTRKPRCGFRADIIASHELRSPARRPPRHPSPAAARAVAPAAGDGAPGHRHRPSRPRRARGRHGGGRLCRRRPDHRGGVREPGGLLSGRLPRPHP